VLASNRPGWNWPVEHREHEMAPLALYRPLEQPTQLSSPVSLLWRPAGHNEHGEIAVAAENWPRGHGPQKSELSIRPSPGAHAAFRKLNALVSCDVSSPTDTATSS